MADEGTLLVPPDRGALRNAGAYRVHMADREDEAFAVVALGPDTWDLFEGLAGRHNGVFGGCWCIYFHPDGPERDEEMVNKPGGAGASLPAKVVAP